MVAQGTWTVHLKDGTELCQHRGDGTEFFIKDIPWRDVATLTLESQWCAPQTFAVEYPEGFDLVMGYRSFGDLRIGAVQLRAVMMLTVLPGQVPSDESVVSAWFWFPDGATHDCAKYNCPDINRYATHMTGGPEFALPQGHTEIVVNTNAFLDL